METRSHYYRYLVGDKLNEIPKHSYKSESDALLAATKKNAYGNDIYKLVAYKCSKCGCWHIGHNHTVMTDELRDKSKKKLSFM